MTSLDEALSGVTSVGVDSAPLIYFVERNPNYVDLMREVLRRVDAGRVGAFSSVITLTEVLTQPKRKGDVVIEAAYRDVLLRGRNFSLVRIDELVADTAATLRARYDLKTPDALQIAASLTAGCQAFLTNDAALARVKEIRVLVLSELHL